MAETAPPTVDQLTSSLAQARRGQQANEQALAEARAELELLRPIADAARELDADLSRDGLIATVALRALTLHKLLHQTHGGK